MWGRAVAVFACLLALAAAADRPKRLTAFGKAPTQQDTPPPAGKGRECKSDADCEAVQYTRCQADRDGRRRCLCRDYSAPVNGQCAIRPRVTRGYVPFLGNRRPEQGLRQTCNQDAECLEGGECKYDRNSTALPRPKICLCRPGFVELGNQCSGIQALTPPLTFTALVILLTIRTFAIN